MKEKSILRNEDGSVLILSLVIMALLLIIGVSATTTSDIENLVTRNVEEYTEALYLAEAAAMEAIQRLNDVSPDPIENPPLWLNSSLFNDILDENNWEDIATFPPDSGIQNSEFLADSQGVVGGSSLDMGKSNVYGYTVYGRYQPPTGGLVLIGVGYRRAF